MRARATFDLNDYYNFYDHNDEHHYNNYDHNDYYSSANSFHACASGETCHNPQRQSF